MQNQFLVDEAWLREHAGDPNVALIDTRPAAEYWAGHLPGARHFDPFPFHYYDTSPRAIDEFTVQSQWIFSALGIGGGETVVSYEANSGTRATRVAWILEYLGHPSSLILDGGLGAMREAKLTPEVAAYAPAQLKIAPRTELLATAADILERYNSSGTRILDVRSEAEYYGENVRARRGGAIPHALFRDWVLNNDAQGRFKSAAELRAIFEGMGIRPEEEVITYCQGGYRAAHSYYALRLAGFGRPRNYLGSWGEWGNREDLPIEKPRRPA